MYIKDCSFVFISLISKGFLLHKFLAGASNTFFSIISLSSHVVSYVDWWYVVSMSQRYNSFKISIKYIYLRLKILLTAQQQWRKYYSILFSIIEYSANIAKSVCMKPCATSTAVNNDDAAYIFCVFIRKGKYHSFSFLGVNTARISFCVLWIHLFSWVSIFVDREKNTFRGIHNFVDCCLVKKNKIMLKSINSWFCTAEIVKW